jgi:hypothetical protein
LKPFPRKRGRISWAFPLPGGLRTSSGTFWDSWLARYLKSRPYRKFNK